MQDCFFPPNELKAKMSLGGCWAMRASGRHPRLARALGEAPGTGVSEGSGDYRRLCGVAYGPPPVWGRHFPLLLPAGGGFTHVLYLYGGGGGGVGEGSAPSISRPKPLSEAASLLLAEPHTPGRGSPALPSSASACLCILSNYCLMQNA